MHEFLRGTSAALKYDQCKSCETRTLRTCIRCGFCWSCHWKHEEATIQRYLLVPWGNKMILMLRKLSVSSWLIPPLITDSLELQAVTVFALEV